MKKIIYFALFTALFAACTVKKRTYTKGYYIDWVKKTDKKPNTVLRSVTQQQGTSSSVTTLPTRPIAEDYRLSQTAFNEPLVLASSLRAFDFTKAPSFNLEPECGDVVTFRNGETLKVKILEITDAAIKYKRCDNLEGPLISVSKSKIAGIKYLNGVEEVFKQEATTQSSRNEDKFEDKKAYKQKSHPISIAVLVLSILGLFLFPIFNIVALAIAPTGIRRILEQPKLYNGEGLILAGKIISWVVLGIWILLILLIILLLLFAI